VRRRYGGAVQKQRYGFTDMLMLRAGAHWRRSEQGVAERLANDRLNELLVQKGDILVAQDPAVRQTTKEGVD
jgi:hypothetical protein